MSDSGTSQTPKDDRRDEAVAVAVFVGIALALVGAVLGLVMAFKRRQLQCIDGPCDVHPHALDGTAIAVISVLLGILIGLVGLVAQGIIKAQRSE
jgi:hypothetical protein